MGACLGQSDIFFSVRYGVDWLASLLEVPEIVGGRHGGGGGERRGFAAVSG